MTTSLLLINACGSLRLAQPYKIFKKVLAQTNISDFASIELYLQL